MRTSLLLIFSLFTFLGSHAQVGPDNWAIIGGVNTDVAPYNYLYYKLVEVKNNGDRYASVINVSVQADANYFEQQATYQLRVDKFEGTTGRFDGVEITTISGNPAAATFFVFNNEVWVRSNYRWGAIFIMTEGGFAAGSPLTGGTWGQTINVPVGYVATTGSYGLKCDFDNNRFFKLPYTDAVGSMYVDGNVGIGVLSAGNKLTLPNDGYIGWKSPSGATEDVGIKTNANNDLTMYVNGPDRIYIKNSNGNVGIGTNAPGDHKLAEEGTIGARKVKVTQVTPWPDFVFHKSYELPCIDSVETFISKHQHLPDMPSAAEVTKNGLDLGEMNRNLLQKVEEQMLYIISLKKEMKEMREMIEGLKKK